MTTIRPATDRDVSALGDMAAEFQDHLNGLRQPGEPPDPTLLTADAFRRDGFGDDPWFNVLLAEDADGPVGYLLYYFTYWAEQAARALEVGDLFVRDAARGQGVGKALMNEATQILRQRGGKAILWTVWDRNPAAIDFYRGLGATTVSEEIVMIWPESAWPAT